MKSEEIIGLAAVAVGGFLLYRALTDVEKTVAGFEGAVGGFTQIPGQIVSSGEKAVGDFFKSAPPNFRENMNRYGTATVPLNQYKPSTYDPISHAYTYQSPAAGGARIGMTLARPPASWVGAQWAQSRAPSPPMATFNPFASIFLGPGFGSIYQLLGGR